MTYLICCIIFILSTFPLPAEAETVKAVYGAPSVSRLAPSTYFSQLEKGEINAIFVPPDAETIRWFKKKGLKVYLSVNAFGGREAWKKYPDSRPVRADGRLLGFESDYKGSGGVCPTHEGWRRDRLKHIETLVRQFRGEDGINGIWLDFIRYPGLWEVKDPKIPDTCYCPRCLKNFQQDTGIVIPQALKTWGTAAWIKKNCRYRWMKWKKEQISSFVTEAREIMNRATNGVPIKLGLFLVPWTKGERQNAISYELAQDAFQLSTLADIISPMVYHKMCGKKASWVGSMIQYYKETASCPVWPIIQSVDCNQEAFREVLEYAGMADAGGFLIYSLKGMKPDLWGGLKAFQKPVNLMGNPAFRTVQGEDLPSDWHWSAYRAPHVKESAWLLRPSKEIDIAGWMPLARHASVCLGIYGGDDRAGTWTRPLPDCDPGQEYLFTCWMYRYRWKNGIYPSLSLWGKESVVNTLSQTRRFQPIRLTVTCPDGPHENFFRFINHNPGFTFWMTKPCLTLSHDFHAGPKPSENPAFFEDNSFPIGIYGASLNNLEPIKKMGINTAVIGGQGENLKKKVQKCNELALRYVISIPRDPDMLPPVLDEISQYARYQDLSFYVNDEPGFYSFPINKALDINRLVKEKFPDSATCMAMVRPQACHQYREASDFFMMDQYPVPHMPMIWLSDAMVEASEIVGSNRVASVIQAFGGKRWAAMGWPRAPTWQEMDCLAFLSVVHGSRGIFFFTYSVIGQSEEGRERLKKVVGRLNRLYPWLIVKNLDQGATVEIVSRYGVGPNGSPAVHGCLKRKGDELLLIAVNTIGTFVEARLGIEGENARWGNDEGKDGIRSVKELLSGRWYPVIDGKIQARFKPYETKAFLLQS